MLWVTQRPRLQFSVYDTSLLVYNLSLFSLNHILGDTFPSVTRMFWKLQENFVELLTYAIHLNAGVRTFTMLCLLQSNCIVNKT